MLARCDLLVKSHFLFFADWQNVRHASLPDKNNKTLRIILPESSVMQVFLGSKCVRGMGMADVNSSGNLNSH